MAETPCHCPVKDSTEHTSRCGLRPASPRFVLKIFVTKMPANGTGHQKSIEPELVFRHRERADQRIDNIKTSSVTSHKCRRFASEKQSTERELPCRSVANGIGIG